MRASSIPEAPCLPTRPTPHAVRRCTRSSLARSGKARQRIVFRFSSQPSAALQIAPGMLFPFDCFKQSLEVPFAETAAALALNDLKEQCWPILHRTREDLQHVAFRIAIDEYP